MSLPGRALRLACLAVTGALALTVFASEAVAATCKTNYDYAGVLDSAYHYGMRTNLSMDEKPGVTDGFVAAWVGVGGPGEGPNGQDQWLQVGYVTFDTGQAELYYEITLPGKSPDYHTVKPNLSPSAKHRIAVLEVAGKEDAWRVWVDDKAVGPVYVLPMSHGKVIPQALAETWNGGTTKCNAYAWQFKAIQVAAKPGGSWSNTKAGYEYRNSQSELKKTSPDSFAARSKASVGAATTAPNEPPLLGAIASRLAGSPVSVRCVDGAQAGVSPGELRVDARVCRALLGYAVSHPWAPDANGAPGRDVALKTFVFLRAIANAARTRRADVDCDSVARFRQAFRELGATGPQAVRLRDAFLRTRTATKLRLAALCSRR